MGYGADEIDIILDELRRGAWVTVGGSRAHTSYGVRDGRWVVAVFDEGHDEEHPSDEATVRDVIARDPVAFVSLLRAPHLRAFRAAWHAGDDPAARAALAAAGAWGDPHAQLVIWDAALAPADEPAPEATRRAIAQHLAGHTAWHAFWDVVGWDRTPANAERGLAFLDRLLALAPVDPLPPAVEAQRASFRKLAGRTDG